MRICVVLQRLQLLVAVTMQLKFVIYVPKLVISMSISTVKTVLTNAENALKNVEKWLHKQSDIRLIMRRMSF
mgnify:FL=1